MTTLLRLKERAKTLESTKTETKVMIDLLKSNIKRDNEKTEKLNNEIALLEACSEFFNKTIDLKVNEVSIKIEDIINKGLSYIYGGNYHFQLNRAIKRNKTTFSFELKNLDTGVSGFEETHGGGIMAVISFLFRVVILAILNKPRILMLDETLSAVSIEYQEKLSNFIRQLCDDMKFNIILISHQPTLAERANAKLLVRKENNHSKVTQIGYSE